MEYRIYPRGSQRPTISAAVKDYIGGFAEPPNILPENTIEVECNGQRFVVVDDVDDAGTRRILAVYSVQDLGDVARAANVTRLEGPPHSLQVVLSDMED